MKHKYVVFYMIKDSQIVEAETVAEAKRLFLEKKKVKEGRLVLDYIAEYDRLEV